MLKVLQNLVMCDTNKPDGQGLIGQVSSWQTLPSHPAPEGYFLRRGVGGVLPRGGRQEGGRPSCMANWSAHTTLFIPARPPALLWVGWNVHL